MKILSTFFAFLLSVTTAWSAELYLCGYNNNWSFDDQFKFSVNGDIHTLHVDKIDAVSFPNGFKIAEKGWSHQYGSKDDFVLDRAMACVEGDGNNIKLPPAIKSITGVTIVFDLSVADAPEVLIRPDLYLAGSINNWANTLADYRFEYINGVYTLALDELDGEFRIAGGVNDQNDDWVINYGGHARMTAGTYDCIEGPGNNMSLSADDRSNVMLTFDRVNRNVRISHPDTEALARGVYISCADNDWWSNHPDYKFTRNGDIHVLHLESLPAEFKVVTSGWEYEFGTNETLVFGQPMTCVNGPGNNFKFPDGVTAVAGATLTLDVSNIAHPTLMVMPDLYLAGEITGWSNTDQKYRFKSDGNLYTLLLDELSGKFRIAGGTTPQWLVNFGGPQDMSVGNTYECIAGSEGDMTVSGGSIANVMLTFDYNDKKLSLGAIPLDPVASGLYLAGAVNGWASDNEDYRFTEDKGLYTLTVPRLSGDFKIVTKDWGLQFGCRSKVKYGKEYSCFHSPDGNNISLEGAVGLDVVLTFDLDNMTLTADGAPTLYLIGEFNEWTPSSLYAFDYEGGVYTLRTRDFSGAFKVSTADNALQFGVNNMEGIGLGQEYSLDPNGGNISFAGLPQRSPSGVKISVFTDGNPDPGTTGIENIIQETGSGAIEYYNLQGIRISRPSHGIYIKRHGSSIEKILVN